MFGGIGGFRKGIEQASNILETARVQQGRASRDCPDNEQPRLEGKQFACVAYYDIDKYATAVYNHNFKESWKPTDNTKVESRDIPDFDLLCGGFPCQSFSIAGKRRGFEDTRGTLFFEIARILRDKRPKMVFLENVAGLLSHDGGRTFGTILDTLRELGYVGQYQVLNSKDFGVPQNRERVFIVGHLGEGCPRKIFPIGEDGGTDFKLEEPREPIASCLRARGQGETHSGMELIGEKIAIPVLTPDREEKRQNGRRFKTDGEPMFTLTGQDIHGVAVLQHTRSGKETTYHESDTFGTLHQPSGNTTNYLKEGMRIRRLTPTECERLQGYPDNWTKYGMIDGKVVEMSDTQRYKMCGNSVTVPVIEAIARRINDAMEARA